mgnify:CR=1 FL=1
MRLGTECSSAASSEGCVFHSGSEYQVPKSRQTVAVVCTVVAAFVAADFAQLRLKVRLL